MKAAILELTFSTSKEELRETIMTIVEKELRAEEVVNFVLRTAKVGNQVIVELDVVILPATPLDTVGRQDTLRERLNRAISQQISGYFLWLNINFVGDSTRLGSSSCYYGVEYFYAYSGLCFLREGDFFESPLW